MQQSNMGNTSQNMPNPLIEGQMQDCITDCLNCHNVCMDHAMSMLGKGNPDNIASMLDCAEICLAAAHSMMRQSALHGHFCMACAAICTHCEEMCATMGDQDCANACRACAQSCEQMVKMWQ
jgi:hypothetical protein